MSCTDSWFCTLEPLVPGSPLALWDPALPQFLQSTILAICVGSHVLYAVVPFSLVLGVFWSTSSLSTFVPIRLPHISFKKPVVVWGHGAETKRASASSQSPRVPPARVHLGLCCFCPLPGVRKDRGVLHGLLLCHTVTGLSEAAFPLTVWQDVSCVLSRVFST